MIQCNADDTIEPPSREYDANGVQTNWSVNGAGYEHQCRSSKLLWDVVGESIQEPFKSMSWEMGDTIHSVFTS